MIFQGFERVSSSYVVVFKLFAGPVGTHDKKEHAWRLQGSGRATGCLLVGWVFRGRASG